MLIEKRHKSYYLTSDTHDLLSEIRKQEELTMEGLMKRLVHLYVMDKAKKDKADQEEV